MYIVYAKWKGNSEWQAASNLIQVTEMPAVRPASLSVLKVPDEVIDDMGARRQVSGSMINIDGDGKIIGFGSSQKEEPIVVVVKEGEADGHD